MPSPPVVGGVAQVFHDLLVELPLLLVAEVEEGKEEDRQEERKEVESGEDQREERTLTWNGHADGMKCGQVQDLSQCECE